MACAVTWQLPSQAAAGAREDNSSISEPHTARRVGGAGVSTNAKGCYCLHCKHTLHAAAGQRPPFSCTPKQSHPVRGGFSVSLLSDESRLEFHHPDSGHSPRIHSHFLLSESQAPIHKRPALSPYLLTLNQGCKYRVFFLQAANR